MNLKRIRMYSLLVFMAIYISQPIALAHSGRTDSRGGHHDYGNVSGLGSYHYHHGYGAHLHPNGICPYGNITRKSTSAGNTSTNNGGTSKVRATEVKIINCPRQLCAKEEVDLSIAVYPSSAKWTIDKWESSNEYVAVVNKNGRLIALHEGSTTITVTLENGIKNSFL